MNKCLAKIAAAGVVFLIATCILMAIPVYASSGDYFIARAPIPVALGVEGGATVNSQIYVFGQDGSGKPLTYAYNPTADNWIAAAPMPISRSTFGLIACNNKIYAIGGVTGYNSNGLALSTGANEMYDPSTNTWTPKASMPTNRSEVEAVAANGKIYVMGGRTAGAQSTVSITEIYDPIADLWISGASMPYPVVLAASAVVDNKIYVIGGQDEFLGSKENPVSPNVQFNQIYNTATNSWSIGQSLPQSVWQAVGAATVGVNAPKRVYVIGGLDGNSGSPTAANQIYNPVTDSWTLGAAFPTTHDYVTNTLSTVNLNDSIYVVGGLARANEGFYEITEQYVPTDYNGTVLPEQPISTPTSTPSTSPTNSPIESVSPTPSIPEFPALTILLLLAVLVVTGLLVYFKRHKQGKLDEHE